MYFIEIFSSLNVIFKCQETAVLFLIEKMPDIIPEKNILHNVNYLQHDM